VPAADLFERELMERERAESPRERAARRANQRWVTQQRLWAAMDRDMISEPGARARFICNRLWPDLQGEVVDLYVDSVRRQAAAGHPLVRPPRASDVVGEVLERLMVEHGCSVTARSPGAKLNRAWARWANSGSAIGSRS
jgi:hypothetical protein